MTTDELLAKMASLMFFDNMWHARARGSNTFKSAPSVRDAMLLALGLTDDLNADLF